MNPPPGSLRRQSEEVSKSISLVDIRVREIQAKLLKPRPEGSLRPKISVSPKGSRVPDYGVFYDIAYGIEATDSADSRVFEGSMVLHLVFKLAPDSEHLGRADLEAFAAIGAVEIAHPYVREIVHSLTFRLGLPPFVLDVAPPVLDRD